MIAGCSKSSYFVDCFRTLFPNEESWPPIPEVVVVLATVVTAVRYEVGVAVIDPVPVPLKFTLLSVCVTTVLPLLGVDVH